MLSVTQNWTNADGSTRSTFVADNVEVFAKGAPIFAISGDDNLTGSSGADLFVFAQPIGNDIIYSFDSTADQIDLIGYAEFASFADVQAHLGNDSAGNAVLTLGDGQTITLIGVDAGALTGSNFVFDQTPVTDNSGAMTVSDGALLPLGGTINNTGTIALDSAGGATQLEILAPGAMLQGYGYVTLSDSGANVIFGATTDATLTNVDNTISGAGQLGNGQMTLINGSAGIVDGNASGHALILDTGNNAIMNYGTIEATGGGEVEIRSDIIKIGMLHVDAGSTMLIDNSVANSGTMETSGTLDITGTVSGTGSIEIDSGATLEFGSASSATVIFANGSTATGNLVLNDSQDFTGQIVGFAGDGTAANSDSIDLKDINFSHLTQQTYTENSDGTGGTLTLGDGTHTANISFVGNYVLENFTLSSDGSGGTLIIDPPVDSTQDKNGLVGGSPTGQDLSFNFDALLEQTSNLPNTTGNFAHIELENGLNSENDQLQSLLHGAAGGQPHDLFGQADTLHAGGVQLNQLNYHQDGIIHP